MAGWTEFADAAPRIADTFVRRHAACGHLAMLATLRPDGFPRISPIGPHIFSGDLVIVGMPGTAKFADLQRDPRFSLHTATVDTQVGDGDAKVWGTVTDVPDADLHARFAEWLFATTGFDLRGSAFEHFFLADVSGAASVEVANGHMDVITWRAGHPQRVIRKH